MNRIDNISDILISIGSILALFEFLPPLKREKLDTFLNNVLTWKYLGILFLVVAVTYLGIIYFPFFTPYVPLVVFVVFWLSSKYLSTDNYANPGAGCIIFIAAIACCAPIIYFVKPQQLELFFTSLVYIIIVLIVSATSKKELMSYPFFAIWGFLLVGLPSLVSYYFDSAVIDTVLYPYLLFENFLKEEFGLAFYLIPNIGSGEYVNIYLNQIESLPNPEDSVFWFKVLTWYKSTAGGYFLFFGCVFQVLFLYFLFKLANFILAAVCVPLMRASDSLKRKFGIQQRRVPIVGAMFLLVGSLIKILVKSFSL